MNHRELESLAAADADWFKRRPSIHRYVRLWICAMTWAQLLVGCGEDCDALPCPAPGWDPQTCACRTPTTPVAADAGFKAGDCTHPDWPDFKICCGKAAEVPGSNCVPAALVDHPCSREGEFQDVKAYLVCCKGLTPVARITTTAASLPDGGRCTEQFALDPSRVCTQCGDKSCGIGENVCNCPDDCI